MMRTMKRQRGFSGGLAIAVMFVAGLFAALSFGMFWDQKFECDKQHPSDQQAALQCLHHKN